jgi:ribosomal protein S27E
MVRLISGSGSSPRTSYGKAGASSGQKSGDQRTKEQKGSKTSTKKTRKVSGPAQQFRAFRPICERCGHSSSWNIPDAQTGIWLTEHVCSEAAGEVLEVRQLVDPRRGLTISSTKSQVTVQCADCGKTVATVADLGEAKGALRKHRCKQPGRLEYRRIADKIHVTCLDCATQLAIANTIDAAIRQVSSHNC